MPNDVLISVTLPRYYPRSWAKLRDALQQSIPHGRINVLPLGPSKHSSAMRGAGPAIAETAHLIFVFIEAHKDIILVGAGVAGKKLFDIVADEIRTWLKTRHLAKGKETRIVLYDGDGKVVKKVKVKV